MNVASLFHEELFLIKKPNPLNSDKNSDVGMQYALGVCAVNTTEEDEKLLNDIVKAIGLERSEVVRAEKVDLNSERWLMFVEQKAEYDYFSANEKNGQLIIVSKTLQALRGSVEDKKELWKLLKDHLVKK